MGIDIFKFLYRSLKGFRLLVLVAILVTAIQVGCDKVCAKCIYPHHLTYLVHLTYF
jgi:hypothetical protein